MFSNFDIKIPRNLNLNSTGPLRKYVNNIRYKKKEGLLSTILRGQKKYLSQLKYAKTPLKNYIGRYSKKSLHRTKGKMLAQLSAIIDIKA